MELTKEEIGRKYIGKNQNKKVSVGSYTFDGKTEVS
jgi:hypothetical protein